MKRFALPIVAILFTVLSVTLAPARTFHLMQIEQVIGGVNGNTSAQAIQLRMRSSFQQFVQFARIRAWDATGSNPVIVMAFPSSVVNNGAGVRILITTPGFNVLTTPTTVPDFTMTNPIPASYLAAGSLTFESSGGTIVYWRLSWGGSGYTGSNLGSVTNDANGNFGPPYASPLPSSSNTAIRFSGPATARSTTNAADYGITPGPAIFTNNAGSSFIINATVPVEHTSWGGIKELYRNPQR